MPHTLLRDILVVLLLYSLWMLPGVAEAASSWNPTLIVNTEAFQQLDSGNGSSDIELQFGGTVNKFYFNYTLSEFQFTNDARVGGNLTATGALSSSGAIRTDSDLTLNDDQTNANTVLTFGSDGTNETLTFVNSEDRFQFSDDVNATGTLSASGAVSFESTTALNGVQYTWPSVDGSANQILSTNGAGTLSWATALTQSSADSRFVNTSGDTMTGALVVGNAATISASGNLITESNLVLNDDDAAADVTVTFVNSGTDETLTWADTADRFSLSDDLNVIGTLSGAKVRADTSLESSGATIIKAAAIVASGALTVVHREEFGTGAYIYSSGATVLALDSYRYYLNWPAAETASGSFHILFGYRGAFDTNLYRSSGSTLRTDDQFSITTEKNFNRAMLALDTEEDTAAQNVITITSDVSSDENLVWRVTASGGTYADAPYNSGGADYAEWFMTEDDNVSSGEVMCINIVRENTVQRCDRPADGNVMGIVSTKPAFIGNVITGAEGIIPPGYVLVGLIGQTPVRVTDEGGPIRIGDRLTAGSLSGRAMRAPKAGRVLGMALENQDFSGADSCGTDTEFMKHHRCAEVTVFVDLDYYPGSAVGGEDK